MDGENSKLLNENNELKKKLDKVEGENAELKKKNAELMEQIEAMKTEKSKEKMAENPFIDMPISRGIKRLSCENEKSPNLDSKKSKQNQQLAIMQQEGEEDGMSVPNWLVEVLKWITRMEMATLSLSYSCKLFNQLCWPKLHGNVKPHRIANLEYHENWYTNSGHFQQNPRNDRHLPVPNAPPPPYILGFDTIDMRFLDDKFVDFVQHIFPRLDPIDFSLNVGRDGWVRADKKMKDFGRLFDLLADKIVKFTLVNNASILELNQRFPGIIQKLHFLCVVNQSPTEAEFGILFDWLALPPTNADIKQKILQFGKQLDVNETNQFIDRIKEEFLNATAPRNFFIKFPPGSGIADFKMENGIGEILTLMEQMQIVRCLKGEENGWNEEGQNKADPWWIGHADETHIDYFVTL